MSAARHDKIGQQGGSGPYPRIALAIRDKINAFAFILSCPFREKMLYHGDFISQRIKIIVHFKQKNTPAVKRGLHKAQSNRNCIRNII